MVHALHRPSPRQPAVFGRAALFGDKVWVRTDDQHGLPTAVELLEGVDERTAVYVCGPPPMIEVVRQAVPLGLGTELHVERFSPLPVVDGAPFELELARSKDVVAVGADQSALAALRAARPNVGYSCQQGFCGTCVQRVLAGEVEHRDHTLTDRQRELGQMLVCVSRAKSRRRTAGLGLIESGHPIATWLSSKSMRPLPKAAWARGWAAHGVVQRDP